MQVFVYDPALERLPDFNARVADFCQEVHVIEIRPSIIGGRLALSFSNLLDRNPSPGFYPMLVPTVRRVHPGLTNLEGFLNGIVDKIEELNPEEPDAEEGETVPLSMELIETSKDKGEGYAIFTCICGGDHVKKGITPDGETFYFLASEEDEDDEEDDGDDDSDGGDDREPLPPEPRGFGQPAPSDPEPKEVEAEVIK